jgi:endo-1,4-beta-xylanase
MNKTFFQSFAHYLSGAILFSAIAITGCRAQVPGQEPGLKDVFNGCFQVGVAINPAQILGRDPMDHEFILKHFNSVTAENEMKFERIHPKPGVYNFKIGDSLVAFAGRNNLFVEGHVLVWHSQTPAWIYKDSLGNQLNRDALLERMKDHIFTVAGRYKGKVNGWHVVNEAIDDDGQMRKSKYYEIIGEDYVQKAFEFAHEADPDAELYYNDYNIEVPGKREGAIKLLKLLKESGVRIDGVGLQGHYLTDFPTLADIDSTIRIFSEMGFKIIITELDLDPLPNPFDKAYAEISKRAEYKEFMDPYKNGMPDSVEIIFNKRYADLFAIFVKYRDVIDRVTFWGLNDRYSWKNNFPIFGRTNYPLLFDRNYQPKPAFYEVIKTAGCK